MSKNQLPQQELLNTQLSEEKNSNSSNSSEELIKREPIYGTPFHLISSNDKYFVAFGKYRISDIQETEGMALSELNLDLGGGWNTLVNLIILITELSKEETK